MRRLAFLFLTVATVLAAWQPASAQHTDALRQLVFVHPSEPVEVMNETGPTYAVIFEELRRLGWQEGRNLLVHRRSGEGRTDQYNNLAREVVQLKPDVIQANGRRLLVQLQAETSSVPIVGMTNDPVAAGLAASLSRPGGNITGVSIDAGLEIMDKYFEILRELLPSATKVALLQATGAFEGPQGRVFREGAKRFGLQAFEAALRSPIQPPEYRRVFDLMMQERVDAVIIGDAAENSTYRQLIAELAAAARLPAVHQVAQNAAEVGGLIGYGVDRTDLRRQIARTIDRILRGDKPGDIPFYQATKYELVVNVRAARALGLEIPLSLLARADEVVE